MKVLWLFNHPAPYKIDFFNELGKNVDLTVIFERTAEGDRPKAFYYEKATSFKEIILSSLKLGDYNNACPCIIKEIKKHPFDIIVVNGWSTLTEMKVIRYLRRHKIPYIFAINGGIAKENEPGWKRRLKEKYLPDAALYLSPDEASSSYLAYYGVDPKAIRLYPYSTIFSSEIAASPLAAEEKKALRNKEGIPGERLFLSAGSFIPRKNDKELIALWAKMPKSDTLMLVGDGPEKETYERQIKEKGLTNVLIHPYLPHQEILRYFTLADASVFLTKEDIYGHVVNECLSQGTPVIASDKANSAKKLIHNGEEGYLVSLEDEEAILKAFHSPLTLSMGEKSIATAKKNTIEAMVKRHEEIFQEFLSR
jgi:glycosyltransferase involved in cell wall biosynthesis